MKSAFHMMFGDATPALRKARGSAPLPTTEMLRPLPPLPQGSVRLSVTPQLRTGDEP